MSNLLSLTSAQLKCAADLQDQIEALSHQLAGILAGNSPAPAPETAPVAVSEPVKTRKKYKLSAAGRAKKVAALKARWAGAKPTAQASDKAEAGPVKKRRKMSAAGRAKIAAGAKARWAKVRAEKAAARA